MPNWKTWCRLCASKGINEKDIFIINRNSNSTISDDLSRICNLNLKNTEDLPSKICKNCEVNVKNLTDFLVDCINTQHMFAELLSDKTNEYDSSHKKYKLSSKDEFKEESNLNLNPWLMISKEEILDDGGSVFESCIESLASLNQSDDSMDEIKDLEESEFVQNKEVCIETDGSILKCTSKNFKPNKMKPEKDQKKLSTLLRCNLCEKDFLRQSNLTFHMKIKHSILKDAHKSKSVKNSILQCKLCKKDFSRQSNLTYHMQVKHSVQKEPHTCNVCGKSFRGLWILERHKNVHLPSEQRRLLSCPHCDKKFNSDSGRWSHIYTVHDKRQSAICEECGKEFSTKHHLGKHKISHRLKKLQCPHCPAKFKGKSGLAAHLEIHGESFPCSICDVVLNTKQLLKDHMIVHSNVKNYKCNFCLKEFKRLKGLNVHLKTHIGIPFESSKNYAEGESIPNFPSTKQLRAINEAAKNTPSI